MRVGLIIAVFGFLAFSCADETESNSCIASTLKRENMIPYTGQDLGCHAYLTLYVLKGQQYFVRNNNCADMIFQPFDCEGNFICDNYSAKCAEFVNHAEEKRIVGIMK